MGVTQRVQWKASHFARAHEEVYLNFYELSWLNFNIFELLQSNPVIHTELIWTERKTPRTYTYVHIYIYIYIYTCDYVVYTCIVYINNGSETSSWLFIRQFLLVSVHGQKTMLVPCATSSFTAKPLPWHQFPGLPRQNPMEFGDVSGRMGQNYSFFGCFFLTGRYIYIYIFFYNIN